jgi:cell division protein FtsN
MVDKAAGKAPEVSAPATDAKAKAADKVAAADPAAKAPDRFWLQAGSFATESDAENLKARLALAGWEAQVQQGQVPDKGVRYRVRLGPYDNTDELNRIKGELARRGFDVAVIRY